MIRDLLMLLVLLCMLPAAKGESDLATVVWQADNGQDDTLLWGIRYEMPISEDGVRVGLSYLQGAFNPGGDVEKHGELLVSTVFEWGWLDIGGGLLHQSVSTRLRSGWTWSYPEEQEERNADIYGPCVLARVQGSLPVPRWGWHLGVLALPRDFGGLDDLGYDASMAEIRAGVSCTVNQEISFSLGGQVREYGHMPERISNDETFSRDRVSGVEAELVFSFP